MAKTDVKRLTAVRLDEEDHERIDALARNLTERAAGATVTASQALRVALRRGLDELEAELGRMKRR